MKLLANFDNIAKARLLHDLFPDEIPALLDDIQAVCANFKANKEAYEKTWDFGLMTFEMWLSLAEKATTVITKYRTQMCKSSKVFSEQLFHAYDYTVIFVNDRVAKYALKLDENSKFRKAVDLLFDA
ncbi:hypothetical protein [Mucilaginibacter paludis]|uniref:Uncharacterized protein n=1 Tax=Mucilaginibacter paludis DSM 18603 TaxID=714943 RepID=H1YIC3_9SPHI|nr:hypothetical protein [Mucilaginibacter paludis]EHQ27536.1 hypothetical protein Mucpa_3437 [Mucilaginibacter paludis DSM 18603]